MSSGARDANANVIIIKKKGGHGGHHGGAWKVAYADFVTAMMALFMVLWLLSQTDSQTQQVISEYFRTGVFSGAPHIIGDGASGQLTALGPPEQSYQMAEIEAEREAQRVRDHIDDAMRSDEGMREQLEGRVSVETTAEGTLIQIFERTEDDMVFDLASSTLKPGLERLLAELGPVLGSMPNDIRVDGHTDARPFPAGSGRDNWQLSFERADQARRILIASGLRTRQIVGVNAHADSKPLIKDNPLAPQNRRLTILAMRRPSLADGPIGEPVGAPVGRPIEAPVARPGEPPAEQRPEPETSIFGRPVEHPIGRPQPGDSPASMAAADAPHE